MLTFSRSVTVMTSSSSCSVTTTSRTTGGCHKHKGEAGGQTEADATSSRASTMSCNCDSNRVCANTPDTCVCTPPLDIKPAPQLCGRLLSHHQIHLRKAFTLPVHPTHILVAHDQDCPRLPCRPWPVVVQVLQHLLLGRNLQSKVTHEQKVCCKPQHSRLRECMHANLLATYVSRTANSAPPLPHPLIQTHTSMWIA